MLATQSILAPGRNCWRREEATRASFLVDAAAYYEAFAEAAERAQRCIFISAWDINGLIRLRRQPGAETLRDFFFRLLESRPALHIYVLNWDFPLVYADDREMLPIFDAPWRKHRRLHFQWDAKHPVYACHHQKVVVIDDDLAFSGGLDFTDERYDTPQHLGHDRRRHGLRRPLYKPFHDTVMLVQGPVARALSDLNRERWRRCTGEQLLPVTGIQVPWPRCVPVEAERVSVAIARTEPAFEGRTEVREVETLFEDSIRAAERFIYIENQYFSSETVAGALEDRLRQPTGPEVAIVLPKGTQGWLEEVSLGVLRARLIRRVKRADTYGRVRLYCPMAHGLPPTDYIKVHAKVMVVDDQLLRIGSANLCNRSMGLDTECDLAIEADQEDAVRGAIAHFRTRLMAEHTGAPAEEVARVFERSGSLFETIRQCNRPTRYLMEFLGEVDPMWEAIIPDSPLLDPEKPLGPEQLIKIRLHQEVGGELRPAVMMFCLGLGLLLIMAGVWRWTPMQQWLSPSYLAEMASRFAHAPWAPGVTIGAYLVGGFLAFPISVLILATALVFQPVASITYALVGSQLSALAVYAVGRRLGRNRVRQLAGSFVNRVSQAVARHGKLTIAVLRVVPVAPYSVINLVAGASHIRFRDFMVGSVLGMTPGIVVLCLLEDRLLHFIRHPDVRSATLLGASFLAAVAVLGFLARRITRIGRAAS